jgi:hypothetical protein
VKTIILIITASLWLFALTAFSTLAPEESGDEPEIYGDLGVAESIVPFWSMQSATTDAQPIRLNDSNQVSLMDAPAWIIAEVSTWPPLCVWLLLGLVIVFLALQFMAAMTWAHTAGYDYAMGNHRKPKP